MSIPNSESNENTTAPLPELHSGVLNQSQVWQLFSDIEHCTRLLEILPKHSAVAHVAERAGITMAQAMEMVAARSVRALQFRYLYEGAEWWDTLMIQGDQFRVVRIRHDFATKTTP